MRHNGYQLPPDAANRTDAFDEANLFREILDHLKTPHPVIEVITTNPANSDQSFRLFKKILRKAGVEQVNHMHLPDRETAHEKKLTQRLEKCNGIFFIGDHLLKISSVLGGTAAIKIIADRYQSEPILLAGFNESACTLSDHMINEGRPSKSYLKSEANVSLGFGFVNNLIIDTSFDTKGRFARVVQTIAEQPGKIYVGLPENTGILIEKSTRLKAIGSNSVMILDGRKIEHSNMASAPVGAPLSMGNLIVHMLTYPDIFDIQSREYVHKITESQVS